MSKLFFLEKFKKANELFRNKEYEKALAAYIDINKSSEFGEFSEFIEFNINLAKGKVNGQGGGRCAKFAGIASIPSRSDCLQKTIDSLINQVDTIGVYFDGYLEVPSWVLKYGEKIKIARSQDQNRDLGDAGKFFWVDEFDGYYFTCDDDLIYPCDYVEKIISCIEEINKPVVVGWHGSIILSPFDNYYDAKSRRVFSFGASRPQNTPVHVLGTGCLGFNTKDIRISLSDFKTPNMADVYFAIVAQSQNIPLLVIRHAKGEIIEQEHTQVISINKISANSVKGSRHNTKELQTQLVKERSWRLNLPDRRLSIGVVGRFKTNSKGGIFKSSRLLVENLQYLGHEVREYCTSDDNDLDKLVANSGSFDFVLVYAPDPERPDFASLIDKVKAIAAKGVPCAVNFSFNLQLDRSKWIVEKVKELNAIYSKPRIFLAAFTNATQYLHSLEAIKDYVVCIPKTLDPGDFKNRDFLEREGIFLGDLAKLTDQKLTFGDSRKWIEQIRTRLPHVNIYALKHYHTDKHLLDYLKILPFEKNGLSDVLSRFRICVCLTPGATFEMIPVEAAMLGTPVVHRAMPQSLSEYISPFSVEVNTPFELGEVCLRIYEREDIWSRLSNACAASYDSLKIENISAAIEIGIRKAIFRSK